MIPWNIPLYNNNIIIPILKGIFAIEESFLAPYTLLGHVPRANCKWCLRAVSNEVVMACIRLALAPGDSHRAQLYGTAVEVLN